MKGTVRLLLTTWCVLLLVMLSEARPAGAEDEAAPAKDLTALSPEELMKIEIATVYGASKVEQKVTEAPSSISIVTSDEIKKYGYRTLADILKSLRSFYITYDRNYAYVGVRGFGRSGDYNSRILLLIDGHRVNDNIYDGAPLGTEFPLNVDLIDRVEVIRGPGSSLYGSNASFAVVNVITRRGGADLKGLEVSGEAGSFDTYGGRATYGNRFGSGLEAFLSGSFFDSEGPRLFFKEFDTPATSNGKTDHTDYGRSGSAFTKLSYADFTLEGGYASRTKGIPTASFGTDFNDPRNKTVDAKGYLDLKYERDLGSRLNVVARLFYDYFEYHGDYIYSGAVNKDWVWGTWWGGEVRVTAKPFERHRLIMGSEYYDNVRQDQKNYNESPYTLFIDDKRKSQIFAFYIQDEYTVLRNLILNAGVRYDHYSTFGGTVNPRLALIYDPFEKTTFKLLYGSAFRSPNVFELYFQDGTSSKANPDLGPEKIRTYELIYEQYIGDNLRGTVAGFYSKIDNLINQVIDPADNLLVFRNKGKVEAKGFEAELERRWESGLTARGSYSFQEAKDVTTDQLLVNSPKHLVKLNLAVPLLRGRVFLSAEEQFASRRKTLAGNFTNSSYITNLTLYSRNILKKLEASVSVYNLFDYRYGDPGAPEHREDIIMQDGRVFRFKVTYTF